MNYKKISGIAFALSFLMAIVLFTGYGRAYVSIEMAKIIFLSSGAIALFMNILSYKTGKHEQTFNLFYWIGSIVLFLGFAFKILHWPMASIIILIGAFILGVAFLLPNKVKKKQKDDDLLDNF